MYIIPMHDDDARTSQFFFLLSSTSTTTAIELINPSPTGHPMHACSDAPSISLIEKKERKNLRHMQSVLITYIRRCLSHHPTCHATSTTTHGSDDHHQPSRINVHPASRA